MPKVYIKLASKEFLELMAEDLAAAIDAGQTHNAEGKPLHSILDEVLAQIPEAPPYFVENHRRR